jgi:hypothetical protein
VHPPQLLLLDCEARLFVTQFVGLQPTSALVQILRMERAAPHSARACAPAGSNRTNRGGPKGVASVSLCETCQAVVTGRELTRLNVCNGGERSFDGAASLLYMVLSKPAASIKWHSPGGADAAVVPPPR